VFGNIGYVVASYNDALWVNEVRVAFGKVRELMIRIANYLIGGPD
jgi:hypothetical protein